MTTKIIVEKEARKIALRLMQERVDKNWSQDELAKRAGLDRKTVNRIENLRYSPSMETFLRLCEALKLKAHEITKN